jgi:FixJ family two-component response regulator
MMAPRHGGGMLGHRITVGWAHLFTGSCVGVLLSPSGSELVSIVDDDPFVRAAASSLVRSFGWDAQDFACAADFLASDALSRTNCLVCDLQMPGMDGVALLERLEADGIHIPTLFITAFASARNRERVQTSSALCVIEKPIDALELETWISRALGHG